MRVKLNSAFFINAAIFSIVAIYCQFIPGGIETQPILILLFGGIGMFLSHQRLHYYDFSRLYVLFFFCFILIAIISSAFIHGGSAILAGVKFLIGPLVFLLLYGTYHEIGHKVIYAIIGVFLSYLFLHLLLGEVFIRTLFLLPDRVGVDHPAFLTTEPSYYSNSLGFMIALIYYVKVKRQCLFGEKKNLLLNASLALILIFGFLTKSAYVFLVILTYIFCLTYIKYKKYFLRLCLYSAIAGVGFILYIVYGPESRIQSIVLALYSLFQGDISIETLLFSVETSGSTRLLLSYIGFAVPFETSWFGLGLSGYPTGWASVAAQLGLPIENHELLQSEQSFSAPTYTANFVGEVGFFVLLLIPFFFAGNQKNTFKNNDVAFVLLFSKCMLALFFLFQAQITHPIPWMMLLLIKKKSWLFLKKS